VEANGEEAEGAKAEVEVVAWMGANAELDGWLLLKTLPDDDLSTGANAEPDDWLLLKGPPEGLSTGAKADVAAGPAGVPKTDVC
jgi:hypothetical protein